MDSNRLSAWRAGALCFALACGAGCQGSIMDGQGHDGGTGSDGAPTGDSAPGTDGGGDPDAGVPFEPLAPGVYATKVKNLLVGLPLTNAEYQRITGDPSQLGAMIDTWMAMPQWRDRMLQFFGHAFQQTQAALPDYVALGIVRNNTFNGGGVSVARDTFLRVMAESFPRTALELIDEHRPFTEVVTTQRFMLPTAAMMLWAFLDTMPQDDQARPLTSADYVLRRYPGLTGVFSGNPVPIASSLRMGDPDYMHWQVRAGSIDEGTFMGQRALLAMINSLVQYNLQDSDWTDWRMVTVRRPMGGSEQPTVFFELPTLRQPTTRELVLQTERVGFFSTPAFLANWGTNDSNQARVTTNQAMIVALGTAFDDTGVQVQITSSAGDSAHAAPGTVCYACHQTLDPMRDFFRQSWTYGYGPRTNLAAAMIPATASFSSLGSTPQQGSGVGDLARYMAGHSHFAAAWTQKLCQYANSVSCDEADPEFVRVAGVFQSSGYDFKRLIHELFSSPLVTFASPTRSAAANPSGGVGIARRDAFCFGLSQRLNTPDVCGLVSPARAGAAINAQLALSIPGDGYARGVAAPLLPTDPDLFFVSAAEGICGQLALALVDPRMGTGRYMSANKDAALDDFVANVMGVPPADPRSRPLRAELSAAYDDALMQPGATPTIALQSTFIIACTAPTSVSSGL